MLKMMFFLIGFGLSIIGFMYIIMYLNYLEIGYNFGEYINFISRRFECILAPIGIIIISIVVFLKGGRNDIRLWFSFKF